MRIRSQSTFADPVESINLPWELTALADAQSVQSVATVVGDIMRKEDVKTEKDVVKFLEDWSEFERSVYVATFRIPTGKVCTYGMVAARIGKPKASRAVANALHNNPLYPIVPCWRVVKSDGGFGGEPKAAASRRGHVAEEGVPIKDGKVVLSKDVLF